MTVTINVHVRLGRKEMIRWYTGKPLGQITPKTMLETVAGPTGPDPGPSCFIAGTLIRMVGGALKAIEEIMVGDIVMSYNLDLHQLEPTQVMSTVSPLHDDLVEFVFDNGTTTIHTHDHPYYVIDKGWSSYRPELSISRYATQASELLGTKQVCVGDRCLLDDGVTSVSLIKIREIPSDPVETYNIFVQDNNNYFADGILVHNEAPPQENAV